MRGRIIINKLSTDKIKEIQYLYLDKFKTQNEISHQLHISKRTVSKYLKGSKFDSIKSLRRSITNMNLRTAKKVTTPKPNSTEIQLKQNSNSLDDSVKSKSTSSNRKISVKNEAKAPQLAYNPANNVSNASSVSSPTSNSTPTKNQPTSNLPTISTPTKVPKNTDNTKSITWGLIKSYLKRKFREWFKNILDDIDLKIHHNYEDRP